jgi:hypothetical protein
MSYTTDGLNWDRMSYSKDALFGIVSAFFAFAWIAVGLRIYVRGYMLRSFGRDDWAMLVAQIVYTMVTPSQLLAIHYGAGRKIADIGLYRASRAFKVMTYIYDFGQQCAHARSSRCSINWAMRPESWRRRQRSVSSFCESPRTDHISGSYGS